MMVASKIEGRQCSLLSDRHASRAKCVWPSLFDYFFLSRPNAADTCSFPFNGPTTQHANFFLYVHGTITTCIHFV